MGAVKNHHHDEIEARAYDFSADDEANAFAMELLMPSHMLEKDAVGVSIDDDRAVAKLANRYQVPHGVMAARLMMLSTDRQEATTPAQAPDGYEGEAGVNTKPNTDGGAG